MCDGGARIRTIPHIHIYNFKTYLKRIYERAIRSKLVYLFNIMILRRIDDSSFIHTYMMCDAEQLHRNGETRAACTAHTAMIDSMYVYENYLVVIVIYTKKKLI